MTEILSGATTAAAIREEAKRIASPLRDRGICPGLGVVLVGDDPASAVYVRNKTKGCEELGMLGETRRLPSTASTEDVLRVVEEYNSRSDIHGVLVQLPLPPQIDTTTVLDAVHPAKDVDGFHPENVGLLVQKRPRFVPCTPVGVMALLAEHRIGVSGRRAVVLGRSDIVGKPMALLLMHADATVTVCHSKTRDLAAVTREADILIAAIGRAGFVTREHVRPGAVVVDVGMNRIDREEDAVRLLDASRQARFRQKGSALVGDVDFEAVKSVASAITPVPGGVGPLTIAVLLRNTALAAAAES
jgi:methylenetetrahydrofolate dehydrogenase (NADP+) / methenyltetrahydrofolate cyclohydrolase